MKKLSFIIVLLIQINAYSDSVIDDKNGQGFFAMDRSDYSESMFVYLSCLLSFGDKEIRNVYKLADKCKQKSTLEFINSQNQNIQQFAFSTLKGYEPLTQKLIRCLAEGGHQTRRSTDEQVVSYCDRVVAPPERLPTPEEEAAAARAIVSGTKWPGDTSQLSLIDDGDDEDDEDEMD